MRTLDALIREVAPSAPTVLIDDDPTRDLIRNHEGAERVVSLSANYAQAHDAVAAGCEAAGENRLDQWLRGSGEAVVVGQMPKSLARLDYVARAVASAGFDQVTMVLGANNKHLSRTMNEVLGRSFTDVSASLGRGKFRCLVARGPVASVYEPAQRDGLWAVGGVFSGAREDRGGHTLATALLRDVGSVAGLGRVLDLGCGNGSVAKRVLDAVPGATITATDADADAVNSARLTLGERAIVTWDDAGAQLEPGFDTIMLNPPFHDGTTVDAALAQHLLDAARGLMAPGGRLYLVHNSHLRYRDAVAARFGTVEQVERNHKFTVLRAQ